MIQLNEVVKRALDYYINYMQNIQNNEVLGKIDSKVENNAKESKMIATKILDSIKAGNDSISNPDEKETLEKLIIIMSTYVHYLDSIKDSIYPPFRNSGTVESSVQNESSSAAKKMYEFYAELRDVDVENYLNA